MFRFVTLTRLAIPLLLMLGIGTRMIIPMISIMAIVGFVAMAYRKIYGRQPWQPSKYSNGKKIVYGKYRVLDDDEK